MMKVIPTDGGYLVVDTTTHRIIGRHADRLKAEKQRRFYRMIDRKRRKRK